MVAFNEIPGKSPKRVITPNGQRATRTGRVAWGDVDALIAELFPPTIASGGSVNQFAGAQYPGVPNLRLVSMQIDPSSQKMSTAQTTTQEHTTVISYDNPAEVTLEYETIAPPTNEAENQEQENIDPVLFLTHRWSIGGEFMTIPTLGFYWEIDGEDVQDVDAGIFIPTIEHSITWPRVIRPPFSVMRTRIGTVNNAALTFSTGVIAAETLLFLGAELKRDIMSDGARAWEVTYKFSEKRIIAEDDDTADASTQTVGGWNHFYRSDADIQPNPGFYRIIREQSLTDGPYFQTAFSNLFLPEP